MLRDVSVRIPAGTVCALVGPSGAGKTTFANLVPRFYEAVAAGSRSTGSTCARCAWPTCGATSRSCRRTRCSSTTRSSTTSCSAARTRSRERGRRGGRRRARARLHPRLPPGLRHHRRRARRPALRRAEAARGPRPGLPAQRPDPDSRRGHLRPRFPERAVHPGGPEEARRRQDRPDHRPPLQHDPRRLADPRASTGARSWPPAPTRSCTRPTPSIARSTTGSTPRRDPEPGAFRVVPASPAKVAR